MSDPIVAGVEADAQKVGELTVAELKKLLAAPPSAVKAFIAGIEGEASAVVTKVRSISLWHVIVSLMSAAALALHFPKFLQAIL